VLGGVISANSHWTITVAKAVLAGYGTGISHSNDYHISLCPIIVLRLFYRHVFNKGLVDCLVVLEELVRVGIKRVDIGPLLVGAGRLWLPDDWLCLESFRVERTTHFC